jgi:hypothetical protein
MQKNTGTEGKGQHNMLPLQNQPTKNILNFWCRNYFFLILAHPVYKM